MVMQAASSRQTETLGFDHGVLPSIRGNRKRLYQVADACVQRNKSPGVKKKKWHMVDGSIQSQLEEINVINGIAAFLFACYG